MIRLESIEWSAGAFALEEVSLSIPMGRYCVLMGATGCGKTTLLEIMCGLRQPRAGRIWLGEKEITELPPGRRGIGYVPQDGALFPTMTVREQLGFALRVRRASAGATASRVEELAAQLGLTPLLDRLPPGLSGGERQRVALGRALAARPQVLLLDEPLSAIDEERRDALAELLRRVQRQTEVTVLHVTHHRGEATRLADVQFRMERGLVREVTP